MSRDRDRLVIPNVALFQRRMFLLAGAGFALPAITAFLSAPEPLAVTSRDAWRRIRRIYDRQISEGHTAVDLDDVRLIAGSGVLHATASRAKGLHRSVNAACLAVAGHLENFGMARSGAIVIVTGPITGFELSESKAAFNAVRAHFAAGSHYIYGAYGDSRVDDAVEVTVITSAQPFE